MPGPTRSEFEDLKARVSAIEREGLVKAVAVIGNEVGHLKTDMDEIKSELSDVARNVNAIRNGEARRTGVNRWWKAALAAAASIAAVGATIIAMVLAIGGGHG